MLSVIAPRRARRQRGFSLIEVLIAMLVLAIGLLGLAALQAQGLKFNTDAYTRSQANILAHDIMDRIRANRDNADDYVLGDLSATVAAVAGSAPQCAGFTTLNATNDIRCWLEGIVATLPSPSASICRATVANCPCPASVNGCPTASSPAPWVDVTLTWLDREFTTSAQCLAVPFHQWDTVNTVCRVAQIWTFYP